MLFLSAVFFGFHSQYQNSLFSVPTSIRPMWPQGLILTRCFLTLSDGSFPGPYTQGGIRVPSEKADVSWRCFPGRSALLPSKFLNLFYHTPLLMRDDIFDISLDCVVSETTSWHARQASATTFPHCSLFTTADDSAKTGSATCSF